MKHQHSKRRSRGLKVQFRTRRDMCYFIGRRAGLLPPPQAAEAWASLAAKLEHMGEMDIPKFMDLLVAIRASTIIAKRKL